MKPIFISYKRANKKIVFDLVKKIEDRLKVKCWVDLDGIESNVQFASKICNAIDESKVVLFMHSSAHLNIDFENDYTIKELNYAKNTEKKVILVKLDDTPLKNIFLLEFGSKNYRDSRDDDQFERLLFDLANNIKQMPDASEYKQQSNKNNSTRKQGVETSILTPTEMFERGNAYWCGNGVPQDYFEAVKWYNAAAKQGHSDAQYSLGQAFWFGKCVPEWHFEAVKWYNAAAKQGHSDAQYNLGQAYYLGKGVEQNYKQAVQWFRKAADQGHSEALYFMGCCYELGHGVWKNNSLAESYYRKSAELGNNAAIAALKRFNY